MTPILNLEALWREYNAFEQVHKISLNIYRFFFQTFGVAVCEVHIQTIKAN